MLSRNKEYPNISYMDTETQPIVDNLITMYEALSGRKVYRADPIRLLLLWMADIIVQERILINESAKMNIPRYAKGTFLDSLAENFKDLYRLQPKAANTTFRFTIAEEKPHNVVIPEGTRITVDGEITFCTEKDLFISAGDITGEVKATCFVPGEIGNGFTPGQIKRLQDTVPGVGIIKVENITTSAGGADMEDDDSFYNRMRESVESFSTAGPVGAYEFHAKTASALVADVSATSPEPGVADIRVLCHAGELPEEEVLELVRKQLNDERVRPLTDWLHVSAPNRVPFTIDVTFYVYQLTQEGAAVIERDVQDAINKYIQWQTEKMGRDIVPSRLIAYLMDTGIKRVEVHQPHFTTIDKGSVAVLVDSPAVRNGGVEDE